MKPHIILIVFTALMLFSCVPKELYYWGQYDQATYQHNKKQTTNTEEDLIKVYEDIIKHKHKGTRGEVPPGVYADYGFLLIMNGRIEEGKMLLNKEVSIYPESKKIVDYMLSKI